MTAGRMRFGIAQLLDRLEGVQPVGRHWRARCPACGGKTLKLAVTVSEGGAHVHCWGGCTEQAVLVALLAGRANQAASGVGPRSGFDSILFETCIAWVAAGEVLEGRPLDAESFERLRVARVRLRHEIARMKALLRKPQAGEGAP